MKNIAPFISGKRFCFEWQDPMHLTSINIEIPDLCGCEYSVWGDWGPMFEFKLKSDEPLIISYNESSSKSLQKSLFVESPMLAETRERLPFYIAVEDTEKDLLFHLFLNKEFELESAEVYRMKDHIKLYETQPTQQKMRPNRHENVRPRRSALRSNKTELRLIHTQ